MLGLQPLCGTQALPCVCEKVQKVTVLASKHRKGNKCSSVTLNTLTELWQQTLDTFNCHGRKSTGEINCINNGCINFRGASTKAPCCACWWTGMAYCITSHYWAFINKMSYTCAFPAVTSQKVYYRVTAKVLYFLNVQYFTPTICQHSQHFRKTKGIYSHLMHL